MMKLKLSILLVFVIGLFLISCKTKAVLSSSVTLGMTKDQVIAKCGPPYKTSANYDKEKNLQEILFYKEKTWDDGGWSWSTTTVNNIFVFKNSVLVAIEQGDEEHNKQTYNTLFVF